MNAKILPIGTIQVDDVRISVIQIDDRGYINMTEILSNYSEDSIKSWIRSKDTLEFLWAWETIHNPDFRTDEFVRFRNDAGTNRFQMSVQKWKEATGAIGIFSKKWKYGAGTFAHKDIAFEFASWLNPVFKLYIIKEFDRLKTNESTLQKIEWNTHRILSKVNHFIHTDAIKNTLIVPVRLTTQEISIVYASEVDMLNKALFWVTARQWENNNPGVAGNIRDYSTTEQLLVLSNLESYNAELIKNGLPQNERLAMLNRTAIEQMQALMANKHKKSIKNLWEQKGLFV